jgi:deazaflavin-dependent oxidoreductase (nitroreductase family)
MSERAERPLARRVQAYVMKLLNVPMRRILSLPFPTPLGRRLMLVSFTGRKTGKAYRQPLSYVRQGNTLLTPGGGKWKWNLRQDQPVRVRLRGRDVLAWPEIVNDVSEIAQLLELMAAANPSVRYFVGIPRGPDGRLDRTRLQTAVQYGFRVVRWHLDKPSGTDSPARLEARPGGVDSRVVGPTRCGHVG